ncbi:zinc finger protein 100-like isoform X2 [Maniola jurtina]|uniref:zinc finger protein 100-like isoform X2 n=1 Tax=Maniola jurtina TaxID=191418 RepID=UPI001E68AF6E|nr:zinc finger protein 100-like isoform X2 [Maniola jurtina]
MGTKDSTYYCLGCLYHMDDKLTQPYNIQSEALKAILQVDNVNLCYICKKIAHKSELFIQNVQRNQVYLENFTNILDSIRTPQSTIHNFQPLINLSSISLDRIELTNDNEDLEKPIVVYSSCKDNVEIKLELKQELALDNYLDEEFFDGNDYQESPIKEEECMLDELKDDTNEIHDEVNLKQLRRTLKKAKLKNISTNKQKKQGKHKNRVSEIKGQAIIIVCVTKEQVMRERKKKREDVKYKNLSYKCEDCIIGFNFKETYEKHMEMHSKEMGRYKCDICKRRMNTMEKLLRHKKYHQTRYKCGECGLTRVHRKSIKEHYTAAHLNQSVHYSCSHCDKVFNRKLSLRRHLAYAQRSVRSATCKFCSKTLSSKEGLKNHIMLKHPSEMPGQTFKHHICSKCGAGFKTPSQLKNHMIKHSDRKDFYCVECDKGFKSSFALTQHLKIASPHVNYLELKLQCDQCDKRFGVKRDLERHMNRIHLNRRPYQCDQCDRAYVNLWSLTDHKRFTHEGEKRPLKHPCPMCDKVFALKSTCKVHMYTHTGERPYPCPECDATFNQPGIRATHVRLVHMRLARDGRPKKHAG